ncbi:MAG: CotH kinase family protein [Lachnospiraceae bacterium]|nr:CotH kinase family protein [Lachnospiraceae bacterium]
MKAGAQAQTPVTLPATQAAASSDAQTTTAAATQTNADAAVVPAAQPAQSQPMTELPVIKIITEDQKMPTCTKLLPPDETLAGATITDNDYVSGVMAISGTGVTAGTWQMKFKVRGNTSAVDKDKKPYKIKLDDAADLMGRGEAYADKEWVLLNSGTNLKTWLGLEVSRTLGMEWTPEMRFVTLEINGERRGLYILIESVKKAPKRVALSSGGYLFEDDAYWWNEDAYFKTTTQPWIMGYTFKYPEVKSSGDASVLALKSVMQSVDQKIATGKSSVYHQIDRTSWAKWIMARDILGQEDPYGSNIYFYKKSGGDKIHMGPLWDFDSAFLVKKNWSKAHVVEGLPFCKLFAMADGQFIAEYGSIWIGLIPSLESTLNARMDALQKSQGAAIDKARTQDQQRWGGNRVSLADEIRTDKTLLHEQIAWMNGEISKMIVPAK